MRKRQGGKGFIVSTELMLIATILVIGLIVGLQAVRVAVTTELADVGAAIGSVTQTYSFSGALGHHGSVNGSAFVDAVDSCDDVGVQVGPTSRCVIIAGATTEAPPPA